MDSALSERVRQFVSRYIVSVEQLEILLLLHDSPERFWSADEVFRVVQSSRGSVVERLRGLQAQGFLKMPEGTSPTYRYQPASRELDEGVNALKESYRLQRVRIIEAIFSAPTDQVRGFADAFKFRKDK